MIDPVLKLGDKITLLPIVHGSGDFAVEVRRFLLNHRFDCLAIPLPESFQEAVEQAILQLPLPSVVYQHDLPVSFADDESGGAAAEPRPLGINYVPIDPCQGVIAAIRLAIGEHLPRRFIDMETGHFEPASQAFPDAYALKKVSLAQFAAAVLPTLLRPQSLQRVRRIEHIAFQLKNLCIDFNSICLVCDLMDWVWIREAFASRRIPDEQSLSPPETKTALVDEHTLYFLLGELPFVTSLYERARRELESDENLAIDGIKELLIHARDRYQAELGRRARRITPKLLGLCLKYIRNLSLLDRHFSPQLSTIITGAKQTAGDGFAIQVLETAKSYGYSLPGGSPILRMGIGRAQLPEGELLPAVSRLPGPPITWKRLSLKPRPEREQQRDWSYRWNPFGQCSWPPEDQSIERFRAAVFDRAQQLLGNDLARTEKFTTSIKDGIDIRDTLRHWYQGDIFVKVLPPNRGRLDAALMLFDSPADPRAYPWRTTWFAEHTKESTLAFFATPFLNQPVGPGICLSTYGGAMFLFPPQAIPDVWTDPRFDFATTLEERLLAATCTYSRCPHVALLAYHPPGIAWRRIAKSFRRQLIHVPLGHFSDETIHRLRKVHVLNGKQVRSYAAQFIRDDH